MTTKATISGFLSAVKDKSDWTSYLADDMVFITATSPLKQITGKDASLNGLRRFYSMVSAFEMRDLIVDGEKACALTRYSLLATATKSRRPISKRRRGNLHRAR